MTVLLNRKSGLQLGIGDMAQLTIQIPSLGREVKVTTVLASAMGQVNGLGLVFRISDSVLLRRSLSAELYAIFNRRSMCRVRADRKPMWGRIVCGKRDVGVGVVDLSGSGAGVVVPNADMRPFSQGTRLDMQFRLAGEWKSLSVSGEIKYRRMVDRQLRLGIQFDPRSRDFMPVQRRIVSYVMNRQRLLLNSGARVS